MSRNKDVFYAGDHSDVEATASDVSFQLESGDASDGSSTTELTEPDHRHSLPRGRRASRPPSSVKEPSNSDLLPDFSDDPDDDTDEDLREVPLDYGRSQKTKTRRVRIEQRWHKYCRTKTAEPGALPKWKKAEIALHQATPDDIYRFLNYCLKLKRGRKGRLLKGIKKASSLRADWKTFRGYYRNVTRKQIRQEDSEEINAGIRKLVDKWELDQKERDKTPVYVQDLTEFNETVLRTQERRFYLGYERIQLCLFTMLGIYTVNRLDALLSLQFKHLHFSIQTDPLGGPPIPLIEIRSEHVKKFLGLTQINNFPLPEIIDDPSLIFSPHVFLFGILFSLNAFEAPRLTSMARLRELLTEDGRQEMQLPLNPEIEEYFIFCRTKVVDGKPTLVWNEPINASTMSGRLRTLGEIHGWLHSMFAHRMRYGGGKVLNESGVVSEAQQNLIMKHSNIRTFLDHYLPRHVDTDMQNIMNGRESNRGLMRAITRMSRWIDKRRPRLLSVEQRASLRQHPEYLAAVQRRDDAMEAYRCDPTSENWARRQRREREVTSTFHRLGRALRKQVRSEFDRKQAVLDIERQLSGAAINDREAKEVLRIQDQMPAAQINLIEKLFTWPTSNSLEDEWQRRNVAMEAVAQYCSAWEGGPLRGRPKRAVSTDESDDDQNPLRKRVAHEDYQPQACPTELDVALHAADQHIKEETKPRKCFQCFGNRQLPDHCRMKTWSEYKSVVRHFRTTHLNDRQCNYCEEQLFHEMHLRRHAEAVHRLAT
ncbi:hypothetical protein Plec18167_006171 [Paecilomyces lecythidis]|uniref:C2H2-type domain-containing protein n=1 Tax=Paecilomyces lecythidis TaxID=3004212 RepID=A0ABR3XCJ6_9EURO